MTNKPIKIIFLDIDGVLNSWDSRKVNIELSKHPEHYCDMPSRPMIDNLNHIIDDTDAYIVISSTWRLLCGHTGMDYILYLCGVRPDRVIGITPNTKMGGNRGLDIQTWMDEHPNTAIESFVILDDNSDMGELLPFLVLTDPDKGLTKKDAIKAIKILKEWKCTENKTKGDSNE